MTKKDILNFFKGIAIGFIFLFTLSLVTKLIS
jgi:Na+-transporting methylmalonyl-CoA/oxaloacetate decarboxylase gamma subunit